MLGRTKWQKGVSQIHNGRHGREGGGCGKAWEILAVEAALLTLGSWDGPWGLGVWAAWRMGRSEQEGGTREFAKFAVCVC